MWRNPPPAGIRVFGLDREGQRGDRFKIGLLGVDVQTFILDRHRGLQGDVRQKVQLVFLQFLPGRKADRQDTEDLFLEQ